jgi:hypothetical protein
VRLLILVLVGACGFSKSAGQPADDMPMIDAAIIDEMVLPPDMFDDKCFGSGMFYLCVTGGAPTGMTPLPDGGLDTGACTGTNREKVMMNGTMVCVVKGDTITLPAGDATRASGGLPLVLVAVTSISITGTLDAYSIRGDNGPNSSPSQCSFAGTGGDNGNGGGGAGGSFGTKGGDGGNGNNAMNSKGLAAAALSAPSPILRGGCRGGTGGSGGGVAGAAGPGGGAVYLVSRGTISVSGVIDASGGGGDGGHASKGGGGGGGSGGMIVFHAMTLTVAATAKINANGGAGGGGAGNNDDAAPGASPDQTTPLVPALGPTTTTMGRAPGGDGAGGPTGATAGTSGANGGGAGGGGFGQIRVLKGGNAASFPVGTVSPIPSA